MALRWRCGGGCLAGSCAICALPDPAQEAVELQAIDRVHRFGQDKAVEIIRFVVDDSIEDKMIRASARVLICS